MRGFGRLLSASVIVFAAGLVPTAARAEGGSQAQPTGKGITGGALLGAALILLGLTGPVSSAVAATFPPAYVGRVASGASGSPSSGVTLTASRTAGDRNIVLNVALVTTTVLVVGLCLACWANW